MVAFCSLVPLFFTFLTFLSLPTGSRFSKLAPKGYVAKRDLDPPPSTIQILELPKHSTTPYSLQGWT